MNRSMSIPVDDFTRILIFDDEKSYCDAVEANAHLHPLVGTDAYDKEYMPGIYIAGMTEDKAYIPCLNEKEKISPD